MWLQRDHKHDLAFRPLETALEKGVIDALYTQSGPFQQLTEATGKFKAMEGPTTVQAKPGLAPCRWPNIPAAITCTDVMAEKHPELAVAFDEGHDPRCGAGRTAKRAAAAILDDTTYYLDVVDIYRGIEHMDLVPNLSPQNLASASHREGLHAEPRLHQERLRCAEVGRAGVPREGGEGTARDTVDEVPTAKLPATT